MKKILAILIFYANLKIQKGKQIIIFNQDKGSFGQHGYNKYSGRVVIQVAGWFDMKNTD